MTTSDYYRAVMADRRTHPRNSPEWAYLTRAARKLIWLARGVPVTQWSKP